jgi:hypothetical protein
MQNFQAPGVRPPLVSFSAKTAQVADAAFVRADIHLHIPHFIFCLTSDLTRSNLVFGLLKFYFYFDFSITVSSIMENFFDQSYKNYHLSTRIRKRGESGPKTLLKSGRRRPGCTRKVKMRQPEHPEGKGGWGVRKDPFEDALLGL